MRISNKKKIYICGILLCSTLGLANKSNAIIPVTDIANLAESIAGNIEEAISWAQEKAMMMKQMDQSGMLTQLDVDNANNAIANSIVRNGAALQEIQNLEVIEMSVPDKDACATLSKAHWANDIGCEAASDVAENTEMYVAQNSDFTSPAGKQAQAIKAISKGFIEDCAALQDGEVDPANPMRTTMCTRASILTGGSTIDTYDPDQQKAVDQFIKLISGPVPTLKDSGSYVGAEDSLNAVYLKEMRLEAFRALVNSSLNEVASMRRSPGNTGSPSPLQMLSEFEKDRFGSTSWLMGVQNVRMNGDDDKVDIMPSEVRRKMAVMDSFMVHMMVLQYKQQLRMEVLQAAALANQINPVAAQ